MTLSSTTTKTTYTGDGSRTVFATGFKFIQNSHVKVVERVTATGAETTLVEGTDYTLTGAGDDSGGTVTATTAPASTVQWIVKRAAAETQGSSLPAGGAFPSATVERMSDLLTMLVQQHSEEIARALVLAETSPTSGLTLPEPSANKLLGWNSGATDLENKGAASTTVTTTAFIDTLLDDADAAAARATLGAGTGNGDASGPASSNDNALARFNGTGGKTIQNSGWTLDDSDVLLGGDNTLQRVNLRDYGEITNAIGSTGGGTQDFDLTLGNVITATVDTSANTFTSSNPTASDEGCSFTLIVTNGGSQTVNWPASVDWAGGTAPTLTTSGVDILTFVTVDGGTIWHGMIASEDSS